MPKQVGNAAAQKSSVGWGDAAGSFQSLANFGLGQMKDQIVCPQAGNIDVRIEPFERIVEVVGQEDSLEPALLEHLLRPIAVRHKQFSAVIDLFPVLRRDAVVMEAEKSLAHLDQPT